MIESQKELFFQLGLGLVAGTFLSWPLINDYKEDDRSDPSVGMVATLTWEQYQNYCHQSAWEETSSKAQVQVQCAQLEGATISWEGYVTNVRLKSIDNKLGTVLKKLPNLVSEPLSCLWGDPIENDCRMLDQLRRKSCQTIPRTNLRGRKEKCHLFGWNRYEFEIFVKMKNHIWGSNAEIVLIGDHSFTNFSLNIYPGDKIRFSGILTNQGLQSESLLGGARPHVDLDDVACIACHVTELQPTKRQRYEFSVSSITQTLYLGTKLILNFLFNPLVIFK